MNPLTLVHLIKVGHHESLRLRVNTIARSCKTDIVGISLKESEIFAGRAKIYGKKLEKNAHNTSSSSVRSSVVCSRSLYTLKRNWRSGRQKGERDPHKI